MKNKIVIYEGGGYDGCIWETNIAYYDSEGNFNSVYHSGSRGCATDEELQGRLKRDPGECEVYDTTDEEQMATLGKEENSVTLVGLKRWLYENEFDVEIPVECTDCGEIIEDVDDLQFECTDVQGAIFCADGDMLCSECMSKRYYMEEDDE